MSTVFVIPPSTRHSLRSFLCWSKLLIILAYSSKTTTKYFYILYTISQTQIH